MQEYTCPDCGKPFWRTPSQLRSKHGVNYCSVRCARKNHAKGPGTITKDGYRRWGNAQNQVYEHRLVVEKKLGRRLKPFPEEVVHHINEDRLDNRPENLEVLSSSEHISMHHRKAKERQWSRKYTCCQNCATTDKPHYGRGYCLQCYGIKVRRAKADINASDQAPKS